MASTDATAYPIKNAAWRVTFPILDADGDLVTGASGLDSEVSKDGGTFADCTNEATEIATSSGIYYLDLTSTEMNADTVAIIVKTSSSGAKTTTIVAYPITTSTAKLGVNVVNFGGSAGTFSSGRPEVNTTHAAGTAWGSGAITAASIASDAITAAKLASDVTTELQNGLATASALSTVAGYLDTEIAAILADTNELQTDWANGGRLDLILDARASQTTADAIETDTQDIQSRLPAALVSGRMDSDVGAMQADTITASALSAGAVDEIIDEVIEGSTTLRQMMRLFAAALLGKASGAATTEITYRNLADSTDRIVATVDADGNRTAVTLDAS